MNIQLFPLEKISVDGKDILLGMELSSVESMLGKGQPARGRHYYFDGEMAIDYKDGKVDFVEFLGGHEGKMRPEIYGISVFDASAELLVDILKEKNDEEIHDCERGYSYQFVNISIGLYREAVPQDIEEMINDAKKFGNPMSEDEIQYEMSRADHWATIGIGTKGYYK